MERDIYARRVRGTCAIEDNEMKNNFYYYDFADGSIESINIDYDKVELSIALDVKEQWGIPKSKMIKVICSEVVGLTDLCMWEDTIIFGAELKELSDKDTPFLKKVSDAYQTENTSQFFDKPLKEGLLDLGIEMSNHITFHIYCYDVRIEN